MLESIALAALTHYSVQPGDTLSGIAAAHGESLSALKRANPQFAADWNLIYPGQSVNLGAASGGARLAAASHNGKVWGVTYGYPNKCGDGDGDGWDLSCAKLYPSQPSEPSSTQVSDPSSSATATAGDSSYGGAPGSFQACVIRAESGGNAQAQNPSSTASGLYGFLDTTWTAVTGLPGPARDYSVAQQNAAFQKEYAQSGTSAWSAYDGC